MGLSWWFTVFVLFVYDGSSDLSCVTFICYGEHIIRCRLKATLVHKLAPLLDLHVLILNIAFIKDIMLSGIFSD
jgi:hypothetical protein